MQVEPDYSRLGQFNPDSSKYLLNKVVKGISRYFSNNSWDLGDRKFKDLFAKEFFHLALQIQGIALWIDYNKNPSILREISQPKFVNLQTLYLGDNTITTIEPLAFLNLPQIRHISLNDNLITNIHPFSKCSFLKLEYISLNGNRVFCLQPFQKFTLDRLEKLKLLDQLYSFKPWENINVLWLIKTSMPKETAEIFFDPKFITTPELCLIKLKIRRKNYVHPCSIAFDGSPSCSPLPE